MTNDYPTIDEALDYDNQIEEKHRYYAVLTRRLYNLKEVADPPGKYDIERCIQEAHQAWTDLTKAELEHVKELIEGVDEETLRPEQTQHLERMKERYHDLQREINIIEKLQDKAFK
jgi:hypothetical protein